MKKLILFSCLVICACVHESAIPLGDNLMQIDISAAPIYGRAGAQRIAFEKAAQATVDAGFDKFKVMSNGGWNEQTAQAGSYGSSSGSFNANAQGQYNPYYGSASGSAYGSSSSSEGSFFNTVRHPESGMVIKMFHYHDKGSDSAVDAHKIIDSKQFTAFGG